MTIRVLILLLLSLTNVIVQCSLAAVPSIRLHYLFAILGAISTSSVHFLTYIFTHLHRGLTVMILSHIGNATVSLFLRRKESSCCNSDASLNE